MMKARMFALAMALTLSAVAFSADNQSMTVGEYPQEVSASFGVADGLPSDDVRAIEVASGGLVFAGTANGLAVFKGESWETVPGLDGLVTAMATDDRGTLFVVCDDALYAVSGSARRVAPLPVELGSADEIRCLVAIPGSAYLGTTNGFYQLAGTQFVFRPELNDLLGAEKCVRQIAMGPDGQLAVAGIRGLFVSTPGLEWNMVQPQDGARSWAPTDVRGAAFDKTGRLWFASPQGVGCQEDGEWTLYTGAEGLPYNDFTAVATAPDYSVWFATRFGAIHYDDTHWAYREGRLWLPDDDVRDVAVDHEGKAWFATAKGVGLIECKPMTLAEKAAFYEDEIDRYHRRTPYGYVLQVNLPEPGVKEDVSQKDSDNDGLWTSMYGAGECFAYGATQDPKAKERAEAAFEALKFLGDVTQGGTHPAAPGFVARTILPTSGPDPNEGRIERDIKKKAEDDKYWKIIDPRWPVSEDGQWYWKTDTSSDELDGHYFFYGLYYDLVADTEEEKARVRDHVAALTDHLIEHDFCLVNHDGELTRWAIYSPSALNNDHFWHFERGLNSLSMLSYLAVAEHVTGDPKYREAANMLIQDHAYAQNALVAKLFTCAGSGNQSDDEMAFMSYYNLLRYETDPELRSIYAFSWFKYWIMEEPEMNPFFNFAFAACCTGLDYTNAFATIDCGPRNDAWLLDAVDTLKRFPLDRVNWRHTNDQRIDIMPLPWYAYDLDEDTFTGKGYRVNGKVLPVDERYFDHWNTDPWKLNQGGGGTTLGDGAVFLMPYYMGLYHGFIRE